MTVQVKLKDIIEGLAFQADECCSYLNTATGEVVSVTTEELRAAKDDAVEHAHDPYRLEDIDATHPIGAALFVPFTILRLRGETAAMEATLTVELRNLGDVSPRQRTLHLSWSSASILQSV